MRHFLSKDDLVAYAVAAAFDGHVGLFDTQAASGGWEAARSRYVRRYLSRMHLDRRGIGCPIAALGGEIAGATPPVKKSYEAGVERILSRLATPGAHDPSARTKAAATLATLVGAVVSARPLASPALRAQILSAAREAVRSILNGPNDIPR